MDCEVTGRARGGWLAGLVDNYQTPRTLPPASNDFDVKLVLRVGLEVVQHDVEVGRVPILVSWFVNLLRFQLSVANDVVTIVGNELVPDEYELTKNNLFWL